MSSISSEQAFFFTSTFSGDPSHLQIIKQATIRFEFNGNWKSCTYNYLDVNPNIARLFQERHFENYGENWMGELEAALKQNPKLIKAAYVTTSDLTTKVGLEILSKIKITLPHSQDPVVNYLGHWISHAFGKNEPPEEYRGKNFDSLQKLLTLNELLHPFLPAIVGGVNKYNPVLLIDEYIQPVRRVNSERWYGSDDISDYLELIVEKELNGYRAQEQEKCRFVLQGNEQGFFKENEEEWVVALTPPVDSAALSLPLGYFLDRELWPQETLLMCYRKIRPEIEQLAEEDPKQRYEHLHRLLSPEYREDMVERLLSKLEEMEFDPEALDGCIMSLEMQQKQDLFGELAPLLQPERVRVKIFTPYNRTQDHWLTGEIQICKEHRSYQVQVWTHDPYGGGEMEAEPFKQLHSTLTKRIHAIQPEAEVKISREKSPYKRRQAAADHTSCGVIVLEDILQRIWGASLNRDHPYEVGVVGLRTAHLEKIDRYLPHGHRTRENFLKRNTLSIEPTFSSIGEKPSLLTPPQIVNEEESLSIDMPEDPQQEKIFKYVKKAGAPSFLDTAELDQPLREAISHNQIFLHYQSGSITLTANSAVEVFKLLLSLHDVPSHREVPTALLSKILDLTFYQSDLIPNERLLGEVCREVISRVQNFVKKEALNLHREIDAAELRGELSEFFKNNPNVKQRIESLEGTLSVLWKKLHKFDKRPLLSKEEMELVRQSFSFRQGKELHELEMEYAKRLEQANLQLNYQEELVCVIGLGALYAKKQERSSLIYSAGFYNYALRLIEDPKYLSKMSAEERSTRKEAILSHLGHVEIQLLRLMNIDITSLHKSFNRAKASIIGNRESLQKRRSLIASEVARLGAKPTPQAIRHIHLLIAEEMRGFTAKLIEQATEIIGRIPCRYAVIGLGSMAREEMTPYSDLEFAILIEEGADKYKPYFRDLTYLLHLKVINLGETIVPALNVPCLKGKYFFDAIIPRGFAFDGAGVQGKGCKTPLGNGSTFELIQTPSKMAQYIGRDREGTDWPKKEPHLPMEMLNCVHIIGDSKLTHTYQEQVREELDRPYSEGVTTKEYLAKHHLVKEDTHNFDPSLGKIDKEGQLLRVKIDLYRLPHLLIDRLALLSNIQVLNTFDRIEELYQKEALGTEAKERLQWLISEVIFQRLYVYSSNKAQQELMNPLIKLFGFDDSILVEKQFALEPADLERLIKMYQILLPFFQVMKAFLSGDPLPLSKELLWDQSDGTLGDIFARLLQYKKARYHYEKALSTFPEDARLLNALGLVESRLGNTRKALEYHQKSLEISEKAYGKNDPRVAIDLSNLAETFKEIGDFTKAKAYLEKALAIWEETYKDIAHYEKLYGLNHVTIAGALNGLGSIYFDLGDFEKARAFIQRALAIKENVYGKEHPAVAVSLGNLGALFKMLGKHEQSLSYLNRALRIREKIYGMIHPQVAMSLNTIGAAYKDLDKYEQAKSHFKKALTILEKFYGAEHPDAALVLNNLAETYRDLEQLQEALSYHQKVLALRQGYEDPCGLAASLNNIGITYFDLGNSQEALSFYQQALEIRNKIYKEKPHPDTAQSLNNIGGVYRVRGDLDEALSSYNQALGILKEVYGEEHPDFANTLNNIGDIYKKQKDFERALKCCLRALEIREKFYGKEHVDIVYSLNVIGGIYIDQGKTKEAIPYYQQALTLSTKFPRKALTATLLHDLGTSYIEIGNPKEAITYLKQTIKLKEEIYGENHSSIAISLHHLGVAYRELDDFTLSIRYLELALAMRRKLSEKEPEADASILYDLGLVYHKLKKQKETFSYYHQSLAIREGLPKEKYLDVAICLHQIGIAYISFEDPKKAIAPLERAVAIRQEMRGKEDLEVADSLNSLGVAYKEGGSSRKAISYFQKALAIRRKFAGEKSLEVAETLRNIGAAYEELREPAEALPYFLEALKIKEVVLGQGHLDVAESCGNVGRSYNDIGNPQAAIFYLTKSLDISKIYGKRGITEGSILNDLGLIYKAHGKLQNALLCFDQALKIATKIFGERDQRVGAILYNLGQTYFGLKAYIEAIPYLEGALIIFEQCLGSEDPQTQNCIRILTIAQQYLKQSKPH